MFLPYKPKYSSPLSFKDVYNGHQFYDHYKDSDMGTVGSFWETIKYSLANEKTARLIDWFDRSIDPDNQQSLTKEEYDQHEYEAMGVPFIEGMTKRKALDHIKDRYHTNAYQKITEDKGNSFTKGFLAPLIAFTVDPTSIAMMIATAGAATPTVMGVNALLRTVGGSSLTGLSSAVVASMGAGSAFGAANALVTSHLDKQILHPPHTWKQVLQETVLMGGLAGILTGGIGITKGIYTGLHSGSKEVIQIMKSQKGLGTITEAAQYKGINKALNKASMADTINKPPKYDMDLLKINNLEWIAEDPVNVFDDIVNKGYDIWDNDNFVKTYDTVLEHTNKISEAIKKAIDPAIQGELEKSLAHNITTLRYLAGNLCPNPRTLAVAMKLIEDGKVSDLSVLTELEDAFISEVNGGQKIKIGVREQELFKKALNIEKEATSIHETYTKDKTNKIETAVKAIEEIKPEDTIDEILKENESLDIETGKINRQINETNLKRDPYQASRPKWEKQITDYEGQLKEIKSKKELLKIREDIVNEGDLRSSYQTHAKLWMEKLDSLKTAKRIKTEYFEELRSKALDKNHTQYFAYRNYLDKIQKLEKLESTDLKLYKKLLKEVQSDPLFREYQTALGIEDSMRLKDYISQRLESFDNITAETLAKEIELAQGDLLKLDKLIPLEQEKIDWFDKTYGKLIKKLKESGVNLEENTTNSKAAEAYEHVKNHKETEVDPNVKRLTKKDVDKKAWKKNLGANVKTIEEIAEDFWSGGVNEYSSSAYRGIIDLFKTKQFDPIFYDKLIRGRRSNLLNEYNCKKLHEKGLVSLTIEENTYLADMMYKEDMGEIKLEALLKSDKEIDRLAGVLNIHEKFKYDLVVEKGLPIRRLKGRVVESTHESSKIKKAGREQYIKDTVPLFDKMGVKEAIRKQLNTPKDVIEYIDYCYDTLCDPYLRYLKEPPKKFADRAPVIGSRRYHNSERKIPMRDGVAWATYNNKYGKGNIVQINDSNIPDIGYKVAYLKNWGTGTLDHSGCEQVISKLMQKAIDDLKIRQETMITPKEKALIDRQIKELNIEKVRNYINYFDKANEGYDSFIAQIGSTTRQLSAMAMLGNVMPKSIVDPTHGAITFLKYGEGYFSSLYGTMKQTWKNFLGIKTAAEKELLLELSDICQLMNHDMVNRFNMEPMSPTSVLGKLSHTFNKLSLMEGWDNAGRSGCSYMLSKTYAKIGRNVANKAEIASAVVEQLKADYLFKYIDLFPECLETHGGREFFTINKLNALEETAERVAKYGKNFKEDFACKIFATYQHAASQSTFLPTIVERVAMFGSTKAGTPAGEMWRFVLQFKSYAIGFLTRGLKGIAELGVPLSKRMAGIRAFKGLLHNKMNLSKFVLSLMTFTYVSDSMLRMLGGKMPRDPRTFGTFLDLVSKSCLGGIIGDYAFAMTDYNAADYLIGAVPSTLSRFTYKAIGKREPLMASIDLLKSTLPFNNIFYYRAAVNALFWKNLKAAASDNVNWKRDHERSVNKWDKKAGGGGWDAWLPEVI